MSNPWQPQNFLEALDAWAALEHPDDDRRLLVTAWLVTRLDDPYRGLKRQRDMPELWFGPVPDTDNGFTVTACSLWINERQHAVRCDSIATLSLPI